ncbi:sigma-54-dependent Fis family transcriptional regulator [Sporomusa sp. KB1]|uniref:sigma-54 interaction domain-containing protein n=1 Tax=Sporomusa sp. KB1 TaxID=943346 RepID=UPI0011AD99D4|nr:sigma 54-interacting transcriptional regulator [Sporomusa sp. KB1]TWH46744.1 transcriptional regulator with PAS, ATPase and Fis domain [Sporomusa sp. KB1]
MELLKKNNWHRISEAYHKFITSGIVPPNLVRPEISNSWQRSRSVNPWGPKPRNINNDEYNQVLEDNAELIEFARPIMQYMYATNTKYFQDTIVHLSDQSGVVMDSCTWKSPFPTILKKRITEATTGTTLTAAVLAEKAPLELGGQEVYRVTCKTSYGGAAPIKDNANNILGILALSNSFGKIPDQPLSFVIAATQLLENLLQNKVVARKKMLESNKYFTQMINQIAAPILIIDNEGQIINANASCRNFLAIEQNKSNLIGKSCYDLGITLNEVISNSLVNEPNYFTLKIPQMTYICAAQSSKTVRWLNQKQHTMLMFNVIDTTKDRPPIVPVEWSGNPFAKIIGNSFIKKNLIDIATRASQIPANVLIDGESGTGKELFAKAIHDASNRAAKPFIAINCGAIQSSLLESELFGYAEGTFTGGKKGGRIGKLELADGGTLLLDEIGEMPLDMQVSLLRFIQDRTVIRLGEHAPKKVDVRIIAATNRDLKKCVADNLFRDDLYYRLKVIHITLPPLRDRKDDILVIANHYVNYFSTLFCLQKMSLTQETSNLLYQYNWPGNIRELSNIIENAVIFSRSDKITPDLLPVEILEFRPNLEKIDKMTLIYNEKELIAKALSKHQGNVSHAAKEVGISRNTMYQKMYKYGLK